MNTLRIIALASLTFIFTTTFAVAGTSSSSGTIQIGSCEVLDALMRSGQRFSSNLEYNNSPVTDNLTRMTLEYIFNMYRESDPETLQPLVDEINTTYHYLNKPLFARILYLKPIKLQKTDTIQSAFDRLEHVTTHFPGKARNCVPGSFTAWLFVNWQKKPNLLNKIVTDIQVKAFEGDKQAKTILKGWNYIIDTAKSVKGIPSSKKTKDDFVDGYPA